MARSTKKLIQLGVALTAMLAGIGSASAQFTSETQTHLDAATRNALGDPDLMGHYRYYFCSYTDNPSFVNEVRSWVNIRLPLTQITDDVWFIGSKYVGQYFLKGSSSFGMIDTVNSSQEAQQYTLPALQSLGLSPSFPLDGIYLTHGHFDHDGGAQFLRALSNPRIYLGSGDATLGAPNGKSYNPILIDSTNLNPQPITIGGRTLTLLPTPGHTPGTTAAIVPVRDNGRAVNLLVIGGSNIPGDIATSRQYLNSVERIYAFAKTMGAEGGMHPHPFFEGQLDNVLAQGLSKPSQFVVGSDKLLRGLAVWRECSTAFATNVDATAIIPTWRATKTHFMPGSPSNSQLVAKVFNGWGPVANQQVTFSVDGVGNVCSAKTGADGIAECTSRVPVLGRNDRVTASFAGALHANSYDLPSEATARVNNFAALDVAIVPPVVDTRASDGLIMAVLRVPPGSDVRQLSISDVRALGATPVSVTPAIDGSALVAMFRRADFATLPDGDPTMVTITGTFTNGGTQDQFVASTTVRLIK
ncbi:MAG TPA: MBL fold metallo-hydrolase [Burkholderiales bacterium]|nr:MBL fold metallo-hydrolase [Burkholderiales bacterium]